MTTRLSTILAAISVVLTAPSQAADSGLQAMMQDLGAVLAWRLGPEAIEERCQAADPEGLAIRKKAASDWLDKNADLIRQVDVRVAEVVALEAPTLPSPGGGGFCAAPAAASTSNTTLPSFTVSPTFTLTSFTTPACVDGISIEALSLSTVMRDCSALIVSPGFTSTSITATSLKSPMSGTFTSVVALIVFLSP